MKSLSTQKVILISMLILGISSSSSAFTSPVKAASPFSTPYSDDRERSTTSPHTFKHQNEVKSIHYMGFFNDDKVNENDRLLSCLPYLLPLLDGDHFGYFIYQRLPPIGFAHNVIMGPLLLLYNTVPFASFLFFLGFVLIQRSGNVSSAIRFNIQQALVIDIALIFPELLGSVIGRNTFPRLVTEPITNFIFYTLIACVFYSLISNLSGKKPNQIPIISEAAESTMGF